MIDKEFIVRDLLSRQVNKTPEEKDAIFELASILGSLDRMVTDTRDNFLKQGDDIAKHGFEWDPWSFDGCPECGYPDFVYDEDMETWYCPQCGTTWDEQGILS